MTLLNAQLSFELQHKVDDTRKSQPWQSGTTANRLAHTSTRSSEATDVTMTVQGADTLTGPWMDLAPSAAF